MKKIVCQNHRLDNEKGSIKCKRSEVSIPDVFLAILKAMEGDPEGKIIIKCHSCRSAPFYEVKYENGKLVFESLIGSPDCGEVLKFDKINSMSESPIVED